MKKRTEKAMIILTVEQLLHLQWIVRDLLKGKTVQMSDSPDDKTAGEKLLKALENGKKITS